MSEVRPNVMPNSIEAERSVLGAMLLDRNAAEKAVEELGTEDFYDPGHREIYDAMLALFRNHRPVDITTLDTELTRRGSLEGIGGSGYLIDLTQMVPTTANVAAYIQIVAEMSTRRKLINACNDIGQESYSQRNGLSETLDHAEKAIFDIAMKRSSSEALMSIREVLFPTYAMIEELSRNKGGISGVPSGYHDLDSLLTGMHPGELILIGARPSMGKTAFAIGMALNAAMLAGKKVAFFSLEMPREQIALRMLCAQARVNMQRVRQGNLSNDDWIRISRAINPLSDAPIYIDDTAGITPTQLRSRCRRLMMDSGLDLVVLDYLGLMRIDGRAENRQLEVSEISRSLKAIALELKVPLVACAQLSRAAVSRSDKRPVLSDLRDSGSIEQDADVVMFLHREAYYDAGTEDKNIGEVIVSKQRNGPLDTIRLAWLAEFATYANLPPGQGSGDTPY